MYSKVFSTSDHNSQIVETTHNIPFMASVEIDCMYIVEKAGEGTGWIIIEAPQEHKIQVKAVQLMSDFLEIYSFTLE
ncbi:MAG: hypothetical protein ACRD5H_11245 [Nitrososphaerales archaeon]